MIAVYAAAGAIALSGVLSFGLYKSVQHSAVLTEQLSTITQERDDARKETARLTEADKRHARQLAQARGKSDGEVAVIRKAEAAGCLDRDLDPDLRAAIGLLDPDGKSAAPGTGGAKADASRLRKNDP